MPRYLMRFLLFSLVLVFWGCASEYKSLIKTTVDQECIERNRPLSLNTAWYNAAIDVVGKHISGLLLIKEMPDSSKRVVFTNEAGVTFFDFGFLSDRTFKAHYVIPQLNKKAVLNLLKDDFELLLGLPFERAKWQAWQMGNERYLGVTEKNEFRYFITDQDCSSLQRLESGSKRKRKLTITLAGTDLKQPDSIVLQHYTFAMKITLKKLVR